MNVPRVGGRVLLLTAPREVAVAAQPLPVPGSGEVRIRLLATGICGTDVHGYAGRIDTFPHVLGHDAVGVVDAHSVGVTAPPIGARVVIDPTIACGKCALCRAHKPYLCASGGYLGMTAPGTMAEYITLPADRVVPLDDTVGDAEATVLEPIAVALHLVERIGDPPPDRPVEIIGGGPLGILLGQTLAAFGWQVAIHEPLDERRVLARRARLTVREPGAAVPDVGPRLVVETSASAGGAELALELAGPGSVLAVVGRAPTAVSLADVLLRELTVVGVRSGYGKYPAAIDLVARGLVRPADVLTHTYPFADAADALAAVADPAEGVLRAVLRFDPTPERTT